MLDKESSIDVKLMCGIVMPISAIDGCDEGHWNDVMEILNDCIEDAGFTPNLVSNADDIGVIQKRIVQNLYDNPIVVCDVSGKNPNVMFELGLRLAFDKPTIIIKDNKTTYSFDTSPIEHIEYPRDLRFNKIADFKIKLTEKINKTHQKATADPNFSTFLKHFGEFKIAKLDQKEVSQTEFVIDELKSIRTLIINTFNRRPAPKNHLSDELSIDICCGNQTDGKKLESLMPQIVTLPEVISGKIQERSPTHFHVKLKITSKADPDALKNEIKVIAKEASLKKR